LKRVDRQKKKNVGVTLGNPSWGEDLSQNSGGVEGEDRVGKGRNTILVPTKKCFNFAQDEVERKLCPS